MRKEKVKLSRMPKKRLKLTRTQKKELNQFVKQKIARMQKVAKSHGGKSLSTEYHGSDAKYLWECQEGHRWESSYTSVVNQESWCPKCANRIISTEALSRMKQVAKSHGGKCLSTEYHGSDAKYLWECRKGHRWEASYTSVVNQDSWCPKCANRIISTEALSRMKQVAKSHGGKCLSTEYHGSRTKYLWECQEGHRWEASYTSVVNQDSWCPKCANRLTPTEALSRMKQVAKSHGGKCLSTEYHGSDAKYLWECRKGHRWESTYHSVVYRNSWCPKCARRKKEA